MIKYDFFFWWSVVSTAISLGLLYFGFWQYLKGKSNTEKNSSQIKVWMNDANGIANALNRIVIDNLQKRYSSTNDVCNAVWSIHASASSLYQSLYEERCVTEEEYKERQKRFSAVIEKQQLESVEKTPQGLSLSK